MVSKSVLQKGMEQALDRCQELEHVNQELDRLNGLLFKYIEEKIGVTEPILESTEDSQEIKPCRDQEQDKSSKPPD